MSSSNKGISHMKPMLACRDEPDLGALTYPLLASPKLDGIRCLIAPDGTPLSRTLKPIRNRAIVDVLHSANLAGLDGELIVGDPDAHDCMRVTNSHVMSFDKDPGIDWKFYVFDIWSRKSPYHIALEQLASIAASNPHIELLRQWRVKTPDDVEKCETHCLDQGFEGLILRRPDGRYKPGRSTMREELLLKLKRYQQAEAKIVAVEPLYHNANEAELDNLGYTKRSQSQAGKIPLSTMGTFICEGKNPYDPSVSIRFGVGTGFTAHERERFWSRREQLIGQVITYKFFPTGSKERPRHPVFVSFRSQDDL